MEIKKSTLHAILKSLSPKRKVNSPKRGHRDISRSISPDALAYITSYLNNHLKDIVEACEASLQEINENPNQRFKKFRYDKQVIEKAIQRLKENV